MHWRGHILNAEDHLGGADLNSCDTWSWIILVGTERGGSTEKTLQGRIVKISWGIVAVLVGAMCLER